MVPVVLVYTFSSSEVSQLFVVSLTSISIFVFFIFLVPFLFPSLLIGNRSISLFDVSLERNVSLVWCIFFNWLFWINLHELWPCISMVPIVLVYTFSCSKIGKLFVMGSFCETIFITLIFINPFLFTILLISNRGISLFDSFLE